MNLKRTKRVRNAGKWAAALAVLAAAALIAANWTAGGVANAAPKGLDTDWGFQISAFRAKGLMSPQYIQIEQHQLLVSDAKADGGGGIFRVSMSGRVKRITAPGALKDPGGLAVAPQGFGGYGGQIFISAPGAGPKSACQIDRVDESGEVSLFAKLPNAGKVHGGVASDCRDIEFAPSGPFAGKLYAVTGNNDAIYDIDSSGKARAFGVYSNPGWDNTAIAFTGPDDPKAPDSMLVATRPYGLGPSAKIGRINVINAKGVMEDNPYLTGFVRPTGFAFAPAGFGSYKGVLFIADAGVPASANGAARDGRVFRVYKGVAREFASGMVDPNCMKFDGKTMVLADPSEHGQPGSGSLIVLKSML